MTETSNTVNKTTFVDDFTKWEKLAVETCPGYNLALEKAKADYYKRKFCIECGVLGVVYDPNLRSVRIEGSAQKGKYL